MKLYDPITLAAVLIVLAFSGVLGGCASTKAVDTGPNKDSATMRFEKSLTGMDTSNGDVAFCVVPPTQSSLPQGVIEVGCVRMSYEEASARLKMPCYVYITQNAQAIQCRSE